MFLKNSRYYGVETVEAQDQSGRPVTAVKLRRLPPQAGEAVTVTEEDRLDIMAERRYRDATRFWYIGDANTELKVNELTRSPGRTIQVPKS